MAPLHQPETLNYDRFANCGNDSDSSPSSSHHRRLVHFGVHFSNDLVQIHEIENSENFSSEEKSACWYSAEEKSQMHESCETMLLRMESGKRPKQNTSYRGLENFHKSNAGDFERTIGACVDAVMDEQDRQWAEGKRIYWDLLREASLEVSKHSASLAYRMAAYDEGEARKAYIAMARAARKAKEAEKAKDDASVSTEMTDTSKSTLVHDIKNKHNKTIATHASSKESEKKKSKRGPPRCPSSGSRKSLGGALSLLKKQACNTKVADRSFQSMVSRAA